MSFKSLVSVVSEQRQEIKQALTLFPYFESWETDLVSECCRVSSVVEFPPDEIILGPNIGNSHAVYFVLEGVCKILRDLFVVVNRSPHQKKALYKLHKYFPSKVLNIESKNDGYVSRLFNQLQKQAKSENGNCEKECNDMKKTDESNHEILLFHSEASGNKMEVGDDVRTEVNNENQNPSGIFSDVKADDEISQKERNSKIKPTEKLKPESMVKKKSKKIKSSEVSEAKKQKNYEVDHHLMILEECKKRRENMIRVFKKTIPLEKPKNTKCFFMEIGFLLKGACFGLEKSEKENFIMTATPVKCLKIPRRFLLQHNPCNIWNRIRLFHSLHLPKEDNIFEYFRSGRMWMERKQSLTTEIISLKNLPRSTSVNEVPYSIRLANPL